jgi:nicotinamidase-related amidase
MTILESRLKVEREALERGMYGVLLIDMQPHFLDLVDPTESTILIKNQLRVIKYCQELDVPLINLRWKDKGKTIDKLTEEIDKVPRHLDFTKEISDSFLGCQFLDNALKYLNLRTLLLMGVYSSACIEDTGIGAIEHKYEVSTAHGLIATSKNEVEYKAEFFKNHGIYHPSATEVFKLFESIKNIEQNTTLLIIDMQKYFLEMIPKANIEMLLASYKELIPKCAEANIPIKCFEYDNCGKTISVLREIIKSCYQGKEQMYSFPGKPGNDCFERTGLFLELKESGINNIIYSGVYSSDCVHLSAVTGKNLEFNTITSSDLITCPIVEDNLDAIRWFRNNGTCYADHNQLIRNHFKR